MLQLTGSASKGLGRDLTDQERKGYRRVFAEALRTGHFGTRPC